MKRCIHSTAWIYDGDQYPKRRSGRITKFMWLVTINDIVQSQSLMNQLSILTYCASSRDLKFSELGKGVRYNNKVVSEVTSQQEDGQHSGRAVVLPSSDHIGNLLARCSSPTISIKKTLFQTAVIAHYNKATT